MPLFNVAAAFLSMGAVGSDPLPHQLVDRARLMADLAALPFPRAARGDLASRQALAQTETWLIDRLTGLGCVPERFPLSWTLRADLALRGRDPLEDDPLADRTWHNLIVEFPGRGPLAGEVLILGAHFDTAVGAAGADDNGTGTAALLELARVLKDRPMHRTVRLIFFNLEEAGLKGSIEYARALKPRLDAGDEKLVGMVSLEMLGYFSDEPGSQRSPIPPIEGIFDPPTVGDFIAVATTKRHFTFAGPLVREMSRAAPELKIVAPDFLPDWPLCPPDLLRSDHAPFMMIGRPGVMLTDTSNFRNPHYHKPSDTIDTIDAERFALVVRAVAGAAHALATPADPPMTTTPGP